MRRLKRIMQSAAIFCICLAAGQNIAAETLPRSNAQLMPLAIHWEYFQGNSSHATPFKTGGEYPYILGAYIVPSSARLTSAGLVVRLVPYLKDTRIPENTYLLCPNLREEYEFYQVTTTEFVPKIQKDSLPYYPSLHLSVEDSSLLEDLKDYVTTRTGIHDAEFVVSGADVPQLRLAFETAWQPPVFQYTMSKPTISSYDLFHRLFMVREPAFLKEWTASSVRVSLPKDANFTKDYFKIDYKPTPGPTAMPTPEPTATPIPDPTVTPTPTAASSKIELLLRNAERAQNLVVKVIGENTVGAGIIFHESYQRLFIATARHVVCREASPLKVKLRFWPEEIEAKLLPQNDPSLDLAVLLVNLEHSELPATLLHQSLDFEQIFYVQDLKNLKHVFPVGHPAAIDWFTPGTIRVYGIEGEKIRFPFECTAGNSGGAIFDEQWRLVGMMKLHNPPLCEAISFARILDTLNAWRLEVSLKTDSSLHQNLTSTVGQIHFVDNGPVQGAKVSFPGFPDIAAQTDEYGYFEFTWPHLLNTPSLDMQVLYGEEPFFYQISREKTDPLVVEIPMPATQRQQRRIDAAVPNYANLGQTIDLLIQVRFPESPLLGLEDWPISQKPASIEQKAETVDLPFPVHPKTGKLTSTRVEIRVVTTDFEIEGTASKQIEVPPHHYSERVTFLLTPRKSGLCRINVEVYTPDNLYIGTVPVVTTVTQQQAVTSEIRVTYLVLVVDVNDKPATPTPEPTATPESTATAIPGPTPAPQTPTPVPSPTPTATPSLTPTATTTPTPTATTTATPSPSPTPTPVPYAIHWTAGWGKPVIKQQENCIDPQRGADHLSCSDLLNDGILLSWGGGWQDISIARTDHFQNSRQYIVPLERHIVRFLEDPWINTKYVEPSAEHCDATPRYQPILLRVSACLDLQCQELLIREIELTSQDRNHFPNLQQLGWPADAPLPTRAEVVLFKTSGNPSHQETITIRWELAEGFSSTLEEEIGENLLARFPVIVRPNTVPYDPQAKFFIFDTLAECEQLDVINRPFAVYTKIGLETANLQAHACSRALVMKGGTPKSICVPAQSIEQKIIFTMESNIFPGNRILIVVANSAVLGEFGRDKAIRTALIEWLKDLKSKQRKIPFNLFVVKENNEVQEILQGENLFRLAESSENNQISDITGLIETNIHFDVNGLQPLENISTIEKIMYGEDFGKIGKVLYFTDSRFLPEVIYGTEYGSLLYWWRKGVETHIVTGSRCSKWAIREGIIHSCEELPEHPSSDDIHRILNQLLR